jgi:hypothetical protein
MIDAFESFAKSWYFTEFFFRKTLPFVLLICAVWLLVAFIWHFFVGVKK